MYNSKYLNRIFQIMLIAIVLLMAEIAASNTLVDVNYSHYFNQDVQSLINENRNVDMIFIGASRVYRTFVPEVFEKCFGFDNVLNAGSPAQTIEGTYYLLEYLLEKFTPKYVVIGVTYDLLLRGGGEQWRKFE